MSTAPDVPSPAERELLAKAEAQMLNAHVELYHSLAGLLLKSGGFFFLLAIAGLVGTYYHQVPGWLGVVVLVVAVVALSVSFYFRFQAEALGRTRLERTRGQAPKALKRVLSQIEAEEASER